MKREELGLAFRKAMLQTDPDDSEDGRTGAAFLAVLDDLRIKMTDGIHIRVTADALRIQQLVWAKEVGQ